MDRFGKSVTQFRERISTLIEELSAANDIIGIPAPALAETLVRSGPNRAQYMKILGDSWKFQLVPFDARAAIETAELVAAVKTKKEQWGNWAKVKFDIQIVATAKAEGVSVIYSDDQDIENYAKRFNIRVIRICDLPVPPPPVAVSTEIDSGAVGPQMPLALKLPEVTPPTPALTPVTPNEEDKPSMSIPTRGDGAGAVAAPSNKPEADPAHPAPVQGSDSGRAQDEATPQGD